MSEGRSIGDADLLVLPGTRATLADLAWLREHGLDQAIRRHAANGRPVLGVCGGFQLVGHHIADPEGAEGAVGAGADGLGLLDVRTEFSSAKVLRLPMGEALGVTAAGYEIHHGRIQLGQDDPFLDGAGAGHVFGTMWHGSLESDQVRAAFLSEIASLTGSTWQPSRVRFADARERRPGRTIPRHPPVRVAGPI